MNSGVSSILLTCAIVAPAMAQSCAGDLNSNGEVNGEDLGILLSAWGPCMSGASTCTADISQDGAVDGVDLGLLLAAWGSCPVVTPGWATLIESRPDPAVVTDPVLRQRIIATGFAWRVKDTGTQIEMLLVPPGTFQMGCIMGSDQFGCFVPEVPVHQVTLTRAFYLGRYEVTQADWQAQMGSNPSIFSATFGSPGPMSRPVETISWNAVQGFLAITGMRLPTEAEWEYACRAGTQTPFYNGSTSDESVGDLAWYSLNAEGQTRPVGMKAPNALGLHDMLGNVWEWLGDWYGPYSSDSQTDPAGPATGSKRIIRGGGWANDTSLVRSSRRGGGVDPASAAHLIGFRIARNP